ncbi:MAG: SpoIIE family protein phosphatase [Lachnospiraceae bacterium]|nr:SpoIIE family protein phosphatase [Lachnospiraceae bacterium]
MPEKSVRDMTKWERMRYSLAARIFRSVNLVSFLFGLFSLVVGVALYAYALVGQYVAEGFNVCRSAEHMAEVNLEIELFVKEVYEIYSSLTEEERAEIGTDAYYQRYRSITANRDYRRLLQMLEDFRSSSDQNDVYVGIYDAATRRLIYVADPDQNVKTACPIGYWEAADEGEPEKFLEWNGQSRLFHISHDKRYGWICTTGYPIRDSAAGRVIGFFLADVTLREVWQGVKGFLWTYALALLLAGVLMAVLYTRHMQKRIVTPINHIAEAAASYVHDKRAGAETGGHFDKLQISTGDELENLALTMADMEQDLADYESYSTRITAEKQRLSTELNLAARIQTDMLPGVDPAFPGRTDFDIYATMTPAKEVGGDFYDFFLIDPDHLGLVMADVSGKGVPAALFMMGCKILLQIEAMSGKSPAELLASVNERICASRSEEMFVTVWFGILDLKTGRLTAANAGHEYPVLQKPGGPFELIKDRHGFVIGGLPGMKYKEYELQLEPGGKLFLYTDGLPEATDREDHLYGTAQMLEALARAETRTPREVLEAVTDAVEDFADGAPQADDLTMLCLEYRGPEAGKDKGESMKEITLDATIENVPAVTAFADAELEAADCPLKTMTQVDVIIDEIFSNIAMYAYAPGSGQATVGVAVDRDTKTVTLRFTDSGAPFDPLARDDPDIKLGLEEREAGGLGVFMVKKMTDEMSYEYKDGRNVLTVKKKF